MSEIRFLSWSPETGVEIEVVAAPGIRGFWWAFRRCVEWHGLTRGQRFAWGSMFFLVMVPIYLGGRIGGRW